MLCLPIQALLIVSGDYRFLLNSMINDVKRTIANCNICKQIKVPNENLKTIIGKAFIVDRPFQHIYIYIFLYYPRSKHGNACFCWFGSTL